MKKRKRIKLMLCMAFLLAMTNVLGVCAEEPDVEDKPGAVAERGRHTGGTGG